VGWSNNLFQLLIVVATTGYSGVFVYSPSTGAGNLKLAIAAQAGTDPYGNAYENGLTIIDNAGGSSGIWLKSGASFESGITNLGTLIPGSGGSAYIEAVFNGPTATGGNQQTAVYLTSQTESLGTVAGGFLAIEIASVLYNALEWSPGGIYAIGSVVADEPGTSVPTAEVWHYVGTGGNPAFAADWANYGHAGANLAFRLCSDGDVEIIGVIIASAGAAALIFTLPSSYVPASDQFILMYNVVTGAAGYAVIQASTGTVSLGGIGLVTGDEYFVVGRFNLTI